MVTCPDCGTEHDPMDVEEVASDVAVIGKSWDAITDLVHDEENNGYIAESVILFMKERAFNHQELHMQVVEQYGLAHATPQYARILMEIAFYAGIAASASFPDVPRVEVTQEEVETMRADLQKQKEEVEAENKKRVTDLTGLIDVLKERGILPEEFSNEDVVKMSNGSITIPFESVESASSPAAQEEEQPAPGLYL
jgi:hypothetical protein